MGWKKSVIFFYLLVKENPPKIIKENFGFAEQAVVDWSCFCRDICMDIIMKTNNAESIGGPK
ncbi:hypothetical protein HZS_2805 [Henneguya salminicola]|nr:hypothetical protein HZS_2805 [Henneguya salminicola]